MNFTLFGLLASSLILVGLSGCGSSASPPIDSETAAADAAISESPATNEGAAESATRRFQSDGISAEIATWDETREFIARQVGKVVVLDVWSTSCVPCMQEFPHLVALQTRYPDQTVCISFNIDYIGLEDSPPESNSDEILKFLVKQKSKLHNVISSTTDDEFYKKTTDEGAAELGSIPAVFVYAADGQLKKRFDNDQKLYGEEGFTYEKNIVPLIEELLANKTENVSR